MNRIRVLTENIATQIAAGEVVDRPSSIVRELVDNGVDAESTRIIVHIEGGGKRLIKVTDNGIGMGRDDLLLSLERHATSKIRDVSDLLAVRTLGFRGEALPSICSVSKMEITSRTADQISGHRLSARGGKLKSIQEVGSPPGTIVEVRDLFFNVPARKKFLRTAKTEKDHIIEVLSRVALPFTNKHFRLDEAGKTVLNLPTSENRIGRLSAILGADVASSMIEAHHEDRDFTISAFLGHPDQSRSRADRILIYINERNIRDKQLVRSIMEGYGQRLMKGRYPSSVIFLNIEPSQIDVNVHPAKQEVRFHNIQNVYRALQSCIEKTLRPRIRVPFEPSRHEYFQGPSSVKLPPILAEAVSEYKIDRKTPEPNRQDEPPPLIEGQSPGRIIGQIKNTYILCELSDGLLLVDQHAAHERIVYENFKNAHRNATIESQSFLVPFEMEFSLKERNTLVKHGDVLTQFGLEIDSFGGNTFLLRSAPRILKGVVWKQFIADLIPVIEKGDIKRVDILDQLLITMACHGAIRAGQRLSLEEMESLFRQLETLDLPTNCPHGRPVFKKFNYYEIEKMFKRVV